MQRHAFAFTVRNGQQGEFRRALGQVWPDVRALLDMLEIQNFSLWQMSEVVFGYYETDDVNTTYKTRGQETLDGILASVNADALIEWISTPQEEMRLMYHDFGIVRKDKSLIRHRVFATRLLGDVQEEYKRRHDALVEARGGVPDPGPDSNFSIWNAGQYIIGYDEIDVTMEEEETTESRQATIDWETNMLGIMAWITDDVDWITNLHHPHVVRLAYHN